MRRHFILDGHSTRCGDKQRCNRIIGGGSLVLCQRIVFVSACTLRCTSNVVVVTTVSFKTLFSFENESRKFFDNGGRRNRTAHVWIYYGRKYGVSDGPVLITELWNKTFGKSRSSQSRWVIPICLDKTLNFKNIPWCAYIPSSYWEAINHDRFWYFMPF